MNSSSSSMNWGTWVEIEEYMGWIAKGAEAGPLRIFTKENFEFVHIYF